MSGHSDCAARAQLPTITAISSEVMGRFSCGTMNQGTTAVIMLTSVTMREILRAQYGLSEAGLSGVQRGVKNT
ncbi:hypothetical protein FQZ97_744640 [compost metagenome]